MAKKKFPKKAKLITFGGFSKMVKIDKPVMRIAVPLFVPFVVTDPMVMMETTIHYEAEFVLEKVYKGYAPYKQTGVVKLK